MFCECVCACVPACALFKCVLHLSPLCIEGKTVLELAAGIGRFTGDLADQAKFVTVVEFMETFMKANMKANGRALYHCLCFFSTQP